MGKIWKAVKWFFSVEDSVNKSVVRKHKHGMRPAAVPGPIEVQEESGEKPLHSESIPGDPHSFGDVYNGLTKFVNPQKGNPVDELELAKTRLLIPHSLEESHLEHLIFLCGFPKTEMQGDSPQYDKRLLQLVRLSMNVYASEVAISTERLIEKLDSAGIYSSLSEKKESSI